MVCMTDSRTVPGSGGNDPRRRWNLAKASGVPTSAASWKAWPSKRNSVPNLASQMRTAFSSMAWNTGSSPGEELMMRSTSDVAASCSAARKTSSCKRLISLGSAAALATSAALSLRWTAGFRAGRARAVFGLADRFPVARPPVRPGRFMRPPAAAGPLPAGWVKPGGSSRPM